MAFRRANCRLMTSNFSESAFTWSASVSGTVSPSRVLTVVSRASDRAISRSESGTDKPCSHFEMVCRTTFTLTASSCWERPLYFRRALMFSLSIETHFFRPHCKADNSLPQATGSNTALRLQFPPQILQAERILLFQVAGTKGHLSGIPSQLIFPRTGCRMTVFSFSGWQRRTSLR